MGPEIGQLSHEEILEIYREQALALEERGVDLFILETFSNIDILLAAIDAIRSFSLLPVVAQLTFSEEGTSLDGTRPADAAARLASRNIQAIGANCTLGPQSLLPVLEGLAAAGRPISAMPNAGFPQRVGDRTVYPRSSPEYFALFAREAAAMGARIIGGCCGTSPEHIRALAEAVRGLPPAAQSVKVVSSSSGVAPAKRPVAKREPESGVWRKLQAGEFMLSVEIDPPKGISLDRVFEQVDKVMATGHVDAIDINSGTLGARGHGCHDGGRRARSSRRRNHSAPDHAGP